MRTAASLALVKDTVKGPGAGEGDTGLVGAGIGEGRRDKDPDADEEPGPGEGDKGAKGQEPANKTKELKGQAPAKEPKARAVGEDTKGPDSDGGPNGLTRPKTRALAREDEAPAHSYKSLFISS